MMIHAKGSEGKKNAGEESEFGAIPRGADQDLAMINMCEVV